MANSALKQSLIRCLWLIFAIMTSPWARAQGVNEQINKKPAELSGLDENRPSTERNFFERLIPQSINMQHAGSIGYINVGFGYNIFKNKRGSLDFSYGNVPGSKGGKLDILAVKLAYRPFVLSLGDWATFYPANPGMFVSYHLGKDFEFAHDSKQFPDNYYWWSTAMRLHISLSNEVKLHMPALFSGKVIKSLSVYSEFNTNELYLISVVRNTGSLHLSDIVKIGLGIRVGI